MRRWTGRLDGVLLAAVAALLWASLGDRGLNLWALSHLRFTQGVNAWLSGVDGVLLEETFNGAVRFFPGPSLLVSWLFGTSQLLDGLRFVALIAGAVVVWSVWSMARSAGGRLAGAVAGGIAALHPWMVSAVTVVSPSIFVLAGLAATTALLVRTGRRGFLWSVVLVVAIAWSLLTSIHGWLWLAPAFVMLFIDFASDDTGAGAVRIRPVALWELLAIPAAVGLAIAINPWWLDDPAHHVGQALRHWMRTTPEPWLFLGERYGAERMAWWVPLTGSFLWLPAVALVPTLVGGLCALWSAVRRRSARAWMALIPMCGAWLLLWSMRTAWHGGVDLRLWVVVTTLPLMAMGLQQLSRLALSGSGPGMGRQGRAMMMAGVVTFVLADALPSLSVPESWHSTLIGRTAGAAASGMWRNPHAPVPPAFASDLTARFGGLRWVVVVNDWEWHPVLDHYAEAGLIGPVNWSPLSSADIAIVVYEDAAPELYTNWPDLAALRGAGRSVASIRAPDGTLLVEAFDLRAGQSP